jgi:hypothetical protein
MPVPASGPVAILVEWLLADFDIFELIVIWPSLSRGEIAIALATLFAWKAFALLLDRLVVPLLKAIVLALVERLVP